MSERPIDLLDPGAAGPRVSWLHVPAGIDPQHLRTYTALFPPEALWATFDSRPGADAETAADPDGLRIDEHQETR